MKPAQILIIKSSWQKLQATEAETIGDIFYAKLFSDAPGLQPLFRSSQKEQSNKLITTLAVIVSRVEKLDELDKAIEQLAVRHVDYGVSPQYYALVGSALMWTLENVLGEYWNEELASAWSDCYTMLADKMINAANYGAVER